ncbi:helix-turn-helix transcriptional regulator [Aurantiacibacter hainanensis]|uniref:helix-turn-helix transcriptional regulator n=1 Tax=Aurantiacibacter hainanensis TaxID=3076114 RepID=UPI0030C6696E
MADTLIPLEAVEQQIHVKRTKIYRMIAAGEFPKPVKIGAASRWPQSEVQAWTEQRKSAR